MNVLLLPLSILCGLILCGTAISLFAVYRAHGLLRQMNQRAAERQLHDEAGMQALRDTVTALSTQFHDLQSHPPVAPPTGLPKPGLNLSKRSQALRMHRHGEGAAQIASALELPRQEVDLLLKVHRIILSIV
jgi:hypothetical protein